MSDIDIKNLPLTEESIGYQNWLADHPGGDMATYLGYLKSSPQYSFSDVSPQFNNNVTSPFNWGSLFGGIGSALGSFFGIGSSFLNYNAQREQQAYERQLQQQIWNREDNKYQRLVGDLKKAGLNPALALGSVSAGATSAVSSSTPQFNSPELNILGVMSSLQGLRNQSLQNAILQAQVENYRLKNERLGLSNIKLGVDTDLARFRYDTRYNDIADDWFDNLASVARILVGAKKKRVGYVF